MSQAQIREPDSSDHKAIRPIDFGSVLDHLDNFGLTPVQFRIYCHLLRSARDGIVSESSESIAKVCKLISCTWKYGCQNRNYVQGESSAQYQVKEETQLFEGKKIPRRFVQPHPSQVDWETGLTNKSNEQLDKRLETVLTNDTSLAKYFDQNGVNQNDVLQS